MIGKGKYFLVLNRKEQVFIELAQIKSPVVNRMLFHTRKSQKIMTIIPDNNQRSFFVIYKSFLQVSADENMIQKSLVQLTTCLWITLHIAKNTFISFYVFGVLYCFFCSLVWITMNLDAD